MNKLSGIKLGWIVAFAMFCSILLALIVGTPISPWWLLLPILAPIGLVLAIFLLGVASAAIIIAALIVGVVVFSALLLVCAIPILVCLGLNYLREQLF